MKKLKINIGNFKGQKNAAYNKQKIREAVKNIRLQIDTEEKKRMEAMIIQRVCALKEYKEAITVFCYLSSKHEVNTRALIERCWEDNKIVAIPKCDKKDYSMKFFAINSYQDIRVNEYGFGEPYENKLISQTQNSICIVPGLVFDYRGNRIGYGAGYYDRFLANYPGCKIGITYHAFMQSYLPKERFDQRLDYILTEKFSKKFKCLDNIEGE